MKKTIIALTLMTSLTAFAAQAETVAPPSTTAAPAAQTAPKPVTQPSAKPAQPKKQESGSTSVYDSIKSGWNGFIDVLTGTKGSSQ